ncbi:hypothetical protein LTR04_002836, partial [Oleoguttula sp. CCFEE 6159]
PTFKLHGIKFDARVRVTESSKRPAGNTSEAGSASEHWMNQCAGKSHRKEGLTGARRVNAVPAAQVRRTKEIRAGGADNMTPDAYDASPSPEHSGDMEGDMSERQEQRAAGDEKSPIDASNGNGQKSSSNAKDPLRPRRKKARRACLACQRAHLTCGMLPESNPEAHA